MKVAVLSVAVSLAACALVGAGSSAQSKRLPTQLPPLPVRGRGLPAALAPVVEAEHAFAQHSIDRGMKPAFLAYAAPDGVIVYRGGPVNAIESWSKRDPAPTGLLTWWPTYADVSRAGDMGWTTGPFEFREKAAQEKPDGTGHFFTVWRRQPDGSWKWVLDLGVEHPAPAVTETVLTYPPSLKKNVEPAALSPAEVDAARQSLAEAERALSDASASEGFRAALLARADDGVRFYRQGTYPLVGREAFARAIKVLGEYVTWKPLKTDVSASGDLGYAYGSYELRTKQTDEKPAVTGHYARVWKRGGGGPWRVVFNVANPAR
ncbi:MAG TPA: nuclear transport factor 2 family protein [Pyrinomonadaceae bacterium]|nr:nuclear transport factor 2 family protein [Pyrinomonadaceae bacterium]